MKNPKAKGNRGEAELISVLLGILGRERTPQDRRNYQFTAWGGQDNADINVKGLESIFFEVKNTKNYSFPAFRKQVEADCPSHKVPVIAYRVQGEPNNFWLNLPIAKLEKFVREVYAALEGAKP